MYSNKENVNILTALLVRHHITDVVVCPGSRNAPLAHNFYEYEQRSLRGEEAQPLRCHPVTDERSAGFYALGLALQQGAPRAVAVCVTSGSALLNLLPAVAEAAYQRVPLVVISADRPQAWIDQMDGQTMPQPGALGAFVRLSVSLPEPHDDTERWHCNRLANEALLACRHRTGAPVHINVPISEPLFDFSVGQLPDERVIARRTSLGGGGVTDRMAHHFARACRPMVVLGQACADAPTEADWARTLQRLQQEAVVLAEPLCRFRTVPTLFDEVLHGIGGDEDFLPDAIFYVGGTLVSKRLKQFLRRATQAKTFRIDAEGGLHDVFMNLTEVVECSAWEALHRLSEEIRRGQGEDKEGDAARTRRQRRDFCGRWQRALDRAAAHAETFRPGFSQMAAVQLLEQALATLTTGHAVHYANSTAIRLACSFARRPVYCNRGLNGIEGSLSTAAGMSAGHDGRVFCVVGDLSFFYDQNALWNQNLRGNLRILLLNNGGGGIFGQLAGLERSAARDRLVAACHHTSAEGACRQYGLDYQRAADMEQLRRGIDWLTTGPSERPRLLEVMTDAVEDAATVRRYYDEVPA